MKKLIRFLRKIGLLHVSSGDYQSGEFDNREDLKEDPPAQPPPTPEQQPAGETPQSAPPPPRPSPAGTPSPERKTNLLLTFLSWIFSIVFLFFSFIAFTEKDLWWGIVLLFLGIILLPAFNDFLWNKHRKTISKKKKFAFIVLGIIVLTLTAAEPEMKEDASARDDTATTTALE